MYQTLAIVLTYLAIVSTYIPPIITELSKASETESATTGAQQTSGSAPTSEATPAGTQQEADTEPPPVLFLAAFLLAIAMVAPFLGGFENIIGIIIIGIGLYEAWKLNRRVKLTISGPHPLVSAPVQTIGT